MRVQMNEKHGRKAIAYSLCSPCFFSAGRTYDSDRNWPSQHASPIRKDKHLGVYIPIVCFSSK